MVKITLGHISIFTGVILMMVTFGAPLFQIETSPGIGSKQLIGTLISVIFIGTGLVMRFARKDLPFSSLLNSRVSNLLLSHLLVMCGVLLAIFSLSADLIEIGYDSSIGKTQVMGTLIGIISTVAGFLIWGSRNDQTLISLIKTGIQTPAHNRVTIALFILATGIAGIFFFNNLWPRLDIEAGKIKTLAYFHESSLGLGADCRVGIYRQSYMALHHADLYVEHTKMSDYSNYPPFTHLFFAPLQVLDEDQAYKFVVIILFLTNIIVAGMMTIVIRETLFNYTGWESTNSNAIPAFLFLAFLFYSLTGYPFLFSIDRGNYDIIAIFFTVLTLLILIKKPESMWWQVITLSIATHLKIYPAALFVVLLIKHGKKTILPILGVNIAMLLSLGFNNAFKFIKVMLTYSLGPDSWAGNHSGFSFADQLVSSYPNIKLSQSGLEWFFTIIPLIVWVISVVYIIKNIQSQTRFTFLYIVSVPLMLLFPSTSHDYALVNLGSAVMGFAAILIILIQKSASVWNFFYLLLTIGLLSFIDRSTYLFPQDLQIISNKYPWILALSILMLVMTITYKVALAKDEKNPQTTKVLRLRKISK